MQTLDSALLRCALNYRGDDDASTRFDIKHLLSKGAILPHPLSYDIQSNRFTITHSRGGETHILTLPASAVTIIIVDGYSAPIHASFHQVRREKARIARYDLARAAMRCWMQSHVASKAWDQLVLPLTDCMVRRGEMAAEEAVPQTDGGSPP